MSNTLAEALPREMERNRELSQAYAEIGTAGTFAKANIDRALSVAEKAMADQDLATMIAVYNELRDNE